MARLAANIGATSMGASAVPRISQKLKPVSAAGATIPMIQPNRAAGLERISTAEARPSVEIRGGRGLFRA